MRAGRWRPAAPARSAATGIQAAGGYFLAEVVVATALLAVMALAGGRLAVAASALSRAAHDRTVMAHLAWARLTELSLAPAPTSQPEWEPVGYGPGLERYVWKWSVEADGEHPAVLRVAVAVECAGCPPAATGRPGVELVSAVPHPSQ